MTSIAGQLGALKSEQAIASVFHLLRYATQGYLIEITVFLCTFSRTFDGVNRPSVEILIALAV